MRAPPFEDESLQEIWRLSKTIKGRGTTSERPTNGVEDGDVYFDTTLGKPIWYLDPNWVDATGSTV